jgi:hypothetical protein
LPVSAPGRAMHSLLILELFVFSGTALAWAAWEYWRTDKLIKARKAEEARQAEGASADGAVSR